MDVRQGQLRRDAELTGGELQNQQAVDAGEGEQCVVIPVQAFDAARRNDSAEGLERMVAHQQRPVSPGDVALGEGDPASVRDEKGRTFRKLLQMASGVRQRQSRGRGGGEGRDRECGVSCRVHGVSSLVSSRGGPYGREDRPRTPGVASIHPAHGGRMHLGPVVGSRNNRTGSGSNRNCSGVAPPR